MLEKTFKSLSISMVIGVVCLLLALILSKNALLSYFSGHLVYGEVVDRSVIRERPNHYSASQRTPELHNLTIQYEVNNEIYWASVNGHVYSKLGIVQKGDRVLISYNPDFPHTSYVLSYTLFNPLVSALSYPIILILIFVMPRWLYLFFKRKPHISES